MAGMPDAFSFDAMTADPSVGGALAFELPPNQQKIGIEWPGPAQQVSDHSPHGGWQPAAGTIENQPGWAWQATGSELKDAQHLGDHNGPSVPYSAASRDSYYGQTYGPQPGWNHDGADASQWDPTDWGPHATQPSAWGQINIGQPFTLRQGDSYQTRHLATNQWDATGKRISPNDAPTAPHELYGSDHYTRPRLTPTELAHLVDWNWAEAQQFPSSNPGYWGVSANEPNMAPRPQGAVVAQMPNDPYVAPEIPGPSSAGLVSYDLGF